MESIGMCGLGSLSNYWLTVGFLSIITSCVSDQDHKKVITLSGCHLSRSVCGSRQGYIQTPGFTNGTYVMNNSIYIYNINNRALGKVKFSFDNFSIHPKSKVVIIDRKKTIEYRKKEYSSSYNRDAYFKNVRSWESKSCCLTVEFHTGCCGDSRIYPGFKGIYQFKSECEDITCSNYNCVPFSAKCNGVNDCGDGSDERQCLQTVYIRGKAYKSRPLSTTKKVALGLGICAAVVISNLCLWYFKRKNTQLRRLQHEESNNRSMLHRAALVSVPVTQSGDERHDNSAPQTLPVHVSHAEQDETMFTSAPSYQEAMSTSLPVSHGFPADTTTDDTEELPPSYDTLFNRQSSEYDNISINETQI